MTELREHGLRTIGLPPINTPTRNYLSVDAAPIIIRTIRRFLEVHGDAIDRIVLCVSREDLEVYHAVLPMYFPRSDEEAIWSAATLPKDIGNADGEPFIEERKIRIMETPRLISECDSGGDEQDDSDSDGSDSDGNLSPTAFAAMASDHDRMRRDQLRDRTSSDDYVVQRNKRYQALLRRAKSTDLSKVMSKKLFALGGTDKSGNRVFSISCQSIDDLNQDEIVLAMLSAMDPLVSKPYVVVLYQSRGTTGTKILNEVFANCDARYRANLRTLYTVHSTVFGKISSWLSSAVSDTGFKDKTANLPGLRQLFELMSPEQVDVPDYVWKHDEKLFGAINTQSGLLAAGEDL